MLFCRVTPDCENATRRDNAYNAYCDISSWRNTSGRKPDEIMKCFRLTKRAQAIRLPGSGSPE